MEIYFSLNIYHIISYHISYHIVSYLIVSYHIVSYRIISYHIVSYHIIYRIIYHIILYHIVSHRIISYHISYHIYLIVSYRIISYHIIIYHIIYNRRGKILSLKVLTCFYNWKTACFPSFWNWIFNILLLLLLLVFSPWVGLVGTRAQSGDRSGSGTLHSRQVLRGSLPLHSPVFRRSHSRRQMPPRPQQRERS
jgi:hypothetical protein